MLADIASGEVDLADILFLIGFVLFVLGAIMAFMRRAFEPALVYAGLGCIALGWLLL
jgi:hypothetical protein